MEYYFWLTQFYTKSVYIVRRMLQFYAKSV
jgi:hypothetical protein